MIVKVVWSSATLAPTVSFDLSIFAFTPTTFLGPLDDFTMSLLRSWYIFMRSTTSVLNRLFGPLTEETLVGCRFLLFIYVYLEARIFLKLYILFTLFKVLFLFFMLCLVCCVLLDQFLSFCHLISQYI